MERLMIEGGRRLDGALTVHGAKNGALPILAATLLTGGESEISNCPRLSDVDAALAILRELGCTTWQKGDVATVDSSGLCRSAIPDHLMREMRSSIVFLGAMLARTGEATLSFPGGCELGPRPIDLHLAALEKLGAVVREEHGRLYCRAPSRLHGASITLALPSVGATENILLAAATADGITTIRNAAREPEIADLCRYLTAAGARITGAGEGTITVEGVPRLHDCRHRVLPDRIEAATYLAATAVTGGSLLLRRVEPEHLAPVLPVLEETGCRLSWQRDELWLQAPPRPRRMTTVRTMAYPGFPTDAAAPLLAVACVAEGTSMFIENIFENRYKYVGELSRMGARIKVEGRVAVVEGVSALYGAQVACTDLRGGAALVTAALAAQGETEIAELHHLDRGYEALEDCLISLGASVRRVE